MVTLTQITNKIAELNSTHFQEMCDEIIVRRYPKHSSFSRSGMATRVDETKVGTPDSYILLENGKFIFNEHTKAKSKKFKKLKSDFESCINENKAGVTPDCIQEINFCLSFTISNEDTLKLKELCTSQSIAMGLWDIHRIARNILYENPDLANQYLGIPLDKSQWIILKSFIENYNKAGKSIAAPLDNPFYFRDSEMNEVRSAIAHNHITIISGSPGVGKSKIVVELLKDLQKEEENLTVWVNSFDSSTIIDDLSSKLTNQNNIILFIDDAHRLAHFQQILGYLRNSTYKNVKIIVTIRDYAMVDFEQLIYNYTYKIVSIKRLTNEQAIKIISEPPFNINSNEVKQKIISLSQGNLRLMLMLAGLEGINESIDSLNDTAEAFDFYFRTLLDDASFLSKPEYIKTIAIISFFNTLDIKNQQFIEQISATLQIEKNTFFDCINEMDKMELISIHRDEVKVSEQNLGFYLFNKAFFVDEILKFKNLLKEYFPKYRNRFKECVITSNNNFGHEKLVEKIHPDLIHFIDEPQINIINLVDFFELFWFAIPERTISFIIEHSLIGSPKENVQFDFQYKTNDFAYNNDEFLSLITHFLRKPTIYFPNAVKASLEYVRRNDSKASELLYTLNEHLSFGNKDASVGCYKQRELLVILKGGFTENKRLEKELFYEIAKTLLKHSFQQFESTYADNTIQFYTYPQRLDTIIEELRKDIWELAFEHFEDYPEKSLSLLNSCANQHPDNNKDLLLYDLDYILQFINEKLNPKAFAHCKYVHKQIWWFRRCGIDRDYFDDLLNGFNCRLFQFYRAMDFEFLYNQYRFEIDFYTDYDKYSLAKIQEIEKYLEHNYIENIQGFYNDYSKILKETNDRWSIRDRSLDVAVTYFFKFDKQNIQKFLQTIIEEGNSVNYVPYRAFKVYSTEDSVIKEIYEIISVGEFNKKTIWLIQLFELADSENHIQYLVPKILKWAENINDNCSISFKHFQKYQDYDDAFFKVLIPILIEKINSGYRISMFEGFPIKMIKAFKGDISKLTKLYCLQDLMDSHFDYDSETFAEICNINPSFLKEYFEHIYSIPELERPSREWRSRFNFVWENQELTNQLDDVLDFIIEKESYYGITDHKAGKLFKVKPDEKENALMFLKKYMLTNTFNVKRLNVIMDIVHKNFPNQSGQFIKLHLNENKTKEVFQNVKWIISQGVWSGNVNPELVRASRWEKVLETINEMQDDIELYPIKNWITEKIRQHKEYAKIERRWRY